MCMTLRDHEIYIYVLSQITGSLLHQETSRLLCPGQRILPGKLPKIRPFVKRIERYPENGTLPAIL